jgi:hypothetical protein
VVWQPPFDEQIKTLRTAATASSRPPSVVHPQSSFGRNVNPPKTRMRKTTNQTAIEATTFDAVVFTPVLPVHLACGGTGLIVW